jgi:hypothetical protein
MKLYKANNLFVLLLLSYLFSCTDEVNPCEIPSDGTTYTISDTAKEFIVNYVGADRIVFKTPAGTEATFEVSNIQDTLVSYSYGRPCESDNSKTQSVDGEAQLIQFTLSNDIEIEEPIFLYLIAYPSPDSSDLHDALAITLGELFSNDLEEGDALLYFIINKFDPDVIFHDSLDIGGKRFYDVLEPNNPMISPKLEIKYTMNEGIVYIKNVSNSKEFIYDRKE